MKKIVFVISTMGIGGAETIFHDMALGLDQYKTEYQVSVVCLYGRGEIGKRLSEKGVELHDCVLKHRFDVKGMAGFVKILKDKKPDILYIGGQTLVQAVSFAASMFVRIPIKIIGVHSHDLADRAAYKLFIDKVTFAFATRIVSVCRSQRRHIVLNKDIPAKKIKVIYNGVDAGRFREKDIKGNGFSVPKGATVVGVLASLRKEKGLDVLMRAIPDVLRSCPGTYFVIAGDGAERQKLEYMAKALDVYSNVRFLGKRKDAAGIISLFDIGCLSSRTENFPVSVLEYMACAKPVVATKTGGIPEMVKDGVNGFLVEPESAEELSEKLVSLIKDKKLRRFMGREGRKMVEDNFTLDRMIDNYREFFKQVSA